MSKCIKCGNLFINNPPDDEMCHICKIADLEAKLAEKEKEIEDLQYNFDVAKNELIRLKKNWNNSRTQQRRLYTELNKKYRDLVEDDYYKGWEITGLRMDIENANQDKISFAVEQLEKVKELLLNGEKRDTTRNIKAKVINVYRVCDDIDNQIEELKKDMK